MANCKQILFSAIIILQRKLAVKEINMKIMRFGEAKTIVSNPMSKHNFFGWPTAKRLQNGKIAVVSSGFRMKHLCPFGKTVISYSENEGETYTAPCPVIDTPLDDRDGGIATFGESGVIVTSFNNRVECQRDFVKSSGFDEKYTNYVLSYLDTVTKEDEDKYYGATFRVSYDCGVTYGELHKSPVTSPHGPVELKNGKILWVGRITEPDRDTVGDYVAAYYIDPKTGSSEYVGRIDDIYDEGEKMISCEAHTVELDDGTLLCQMRVQSCNDVRLQRLFSVYQTESTNGGRSWTSPVILLDKKGGYPPFLFKHSSGVLISVYSRTRAKEPYGVLAMISTDNGKSWSTEHPICTLDGAWRDLGYPSTVELNDGSLITVFYSKSSDGSSVILQQKWRIENEG